MSPSKKIREASPTGILVDVLDDVERAFKAEVIRDLHKILNKTYVDSGVWACLWIADLPRLRDIRDAAREDPQAVYTEICRRSGFCIRELASSHSPITEVVKKREVTNIQMVWSHRMSQLVGTPSQRPLSPLPENTCYTRDNRVCLISKSRFNLQIAKIVRNHFITLGIGKREQFWDALRYFWPDRVNAWESAILQLELFAGPCGNEMCLCSHVRELWDVGYFGLKPLSKSDDGKKLRVMFYWLPEYPFSRKRDPGDVRLKERNTACPQACKLWNRDTEKKLASGDVLEFTTWNPSQLPLPSLELLELRWYIARLLAMSGASNIIAADLGFHPSTLRGVDEFQAYAKSA
ncbi:hypothetical protein BO94DRAFT_570584 [Aspergillus sclerotioniger CBS 115572]|uniref:HNH nuclease domain-containing protein n=1 Tax=Aspergillus sclerotioniger CBS 115572 TaxID=1450535 RepID=A0A317XG90_9EURO|nr:hypothetical protein BO94DRAFT_570584 [Aspergillus sclerotioniger CBS 115572]PWY96238.1 hypothetical protein BO94DRAFT_570584 [Aspergillus sclerotioniger CBS 115572]